MRSERSLSETAFLRYGFHYVNVLVEGITHKIYILEGHTSFQKMRMDQVNTMRPERSLFENAFLRHGFHYVNVLVEGITRKIYILERHTSF